MVDVLGRRDVEIPPRDDVPLADRLHEAVVGVGGCGADAAWRFPLRQAGLRLVRGQIVEGVGSRQRRPRPGSVAGVSGAADSSLAAGSDRHP